MILLGLAEICDEVLVCDLRDDLIEELALSLAGVGYEDSQDCLEIFTVDDTLLMWSKFKRDHNFDNESFINPSEIEVLNDMVEDKIREIVGRLKERTNY